MNERELRESEEEVRQDEIKVNLFTQRRAPVIDH